MGTFFKFRTNRSGEWYDAQMNGKGVIDSPDGKRYAGEFQDNERSGFGSWMK